MKFEYLIKMHQNPWRQVTRCRFAFELSALLPMLDRTPVDGERGERTWWLNDYMSLRIRVAR